jgi:membrane protein YqaA with SNARE-associated domain
MTLWFLLALVFTLQEPISTSVILLQAYQSHYNLWLIHLLFTVITIAEIVGGYYLGRWIEGKFSTSRFVIALKKRVDGFSAFIGKYGKIVGLIVFIPLAFPLTAIIIPWFDVSLTEAIIYVFIGEVVFWYAYEWLLVLGVHSFVTDSQGALVVILLVSAAISVGINIMVRKSKK